MAQPVGWKAGFVAYQIIKDRPLILVDDEHSKQKVAELETRAAELKVKKAAG
jgi:hypothetical protein